MRPTHSRKNKPGYRAKPKFDAKMLVAAATDAVREALRAHKSHGDSIVVWRGGRVVILPPEKIEL